MEQSKIVQQTTEYLLSLPDESNLTMRQAVQSACPKAEKDITDTALFGLLDEITDAVGRNGVILDFTAHEGLLEGLPFDLDFIVRKKRFQKVQLVSNLLCYGPCPKPEDAIEQRLTISSTGGVWFTEYLFGEIGLSNNPVGRKIQLSIGRERAMAIISKVANYIEEDQEKIWCTDIGSWNLKATCLNGENYNVEGALFGGVIVDGVDLTDYIRSQIPIENLALFGETFEEE